MINNKLRVGNFTSSEIVSLTTDGSRPMTPEEKKEFQDNGGDKRKKNTWDFGVTFYSYIEEKNMERRLERSLTTESNARPLAWGNLVEYFVFSQLGLDYKPCSKSTIQHPEISYWAGSPDAEKFENQKVAVDIKCPITLKSFCQLVDSFKDGGIDLVRKNHKDGEKYYWQIVSNAVLLGTNKGELIVYCPYTDELEEIREFANNYDGPNIHRYFFITVASDDELPNIKKGGYYENINKLAFDIPQEDIDLLTKRVKEAGKLLINNKSDDTINE